MGGGIIEMSFYVENNLFEDFYGVAFLGYFLIINLDPRREEKVKRLYC